MHPFLDNAMSELVVANAMIRDRAGVQQARELVRNAFKQVADRSLDLIMPISQAGALTTPMVIDTLEKFKSLSVVKPPNPAIPMARIWKATLEDIGQDQYALTVELTGPENKVFKNVGDDKVSLVRVFGYMLSIRWRDAY